MELNEHALEQILARQTDEFTRRMDQSTGELRQFVRENTAEMRTFVQENTAEMRQFVNEQAAETRLHFDVITEALRSDIKGIAEGHELLREDLQRQREEFTESLAVQSRDLRTAVRSVADDVREIRQDVELIKTDMEIIKSELAIIRSDLKQKVGRDEFAVLEARVALLERAARHH